MQANYIAQFQRAGSQLAANSFGFAQSSRDLVGTTFAEMFAQMRSGSDDAGYASSTKWNDTSNPKWNDTYRMQTSSQNDVGSDYNREVSSESKESGRAEETESSTDRCEEDSFTTKADEKTQSQSYDEGSVAGNETSVIKSEADQEQTEMSGHDAGMEGNDPALLAVLADFLLKQTNGSDHDTVTGPKINLDESARKELASIIRELGGQTGQDKTQEVLSRLKGLMEKYPGLAKTLESHLPKVAAGQDEGRTLSSLKELMAQMGLKSQGIELKKTRAQAGHDGKSQTEFSSLESAASEHSRRRIKTGQTEQEQVGMLKDKQTGGSGEAGKTGNSSDKTMNFTMSENARGFQKTQEGGSFRRTLTDAGDRIGQSAAARQDMAAKGTDKAVKVSSNQEATIKNFQDVKALLDKQLIQVKETSVSTMTIKLNPEELGKIKIQLELLENGKLQGKIFVENEVTKNSLLQHAEAMKEQIKAQGVSLEGFEIDMGSEYMDQDSSRFDQQRQFDRQSEKGHRGSHADFIYDEEMSEQLRSALQESAQPIGKLNILA